MEPNNNKSIASSLLKKKTYKFKTQVKRICQILCKANGEMQPSTLWRRLFKKEMVQLCKAPASFPYTAKSYWHGPVKRGINKIPMQTQFYIAEQQTAILKVHLERETRNKNCKKEKKKWIIVCSRYDYIFRKHKRIGEKSYQKQFKK